ncbi:MAG: UbiA family prenyltransferase, partial [Gammaproteobacteria bacterium]
TYFVLTGEYSTLPWLASVVPFFLVNNLLLLNQYPDIKADTEVGRRHFPIAYGTGISNIMYALFVLATIASIFTGIILGYFPTLSLMALIPIPLAFYSLTGAIRHGESIGEYPQFLGANVLVSVLTPLLLAISLLIG